VKIRMVNQEIKREDLVAINLNDMLYHLQSEKTFLELCKYKRPSDKEISRQIRIRHKAQEDTPKFLGHVKRISQIYDRKDELARLVMSFGNSREQILRNIGKMTRASPGIMRAYEDFLERYSNPNAHPEIRGVESWRVKPETLEGKVRLGPIDLCDSGKIPLQVLYAMEQLDLRYCNAYPKTSY
jgi:hypothetical protein